MKLIKKNQEPQSLTFHKKQEYATYENYPEKSELRQSLLEEQGYICCYCMARIAENKMRIEHWQPQSKNSLLELDYSNLLAACQGGEGGSKRQYHCDKSKGEDEILVHPNEAIGMNCETLVKFRRNGIVYSDNEQVDREINDILRLNIQNLVEARAAVLDSFKKVILEKYAGSLNKQKLQKIFDSLCVKKDGKYNEYCRVALTYLEQRIK